ncbi:MAG TPA: SDR family NAD(P)-dependent oxidoreductase [Solirubrobacterales bacterium]|nr:SDR family NAD(P)-dependent oxidoreductase [Solirubrobacterales bacterium]
MSGPVLARVLDAALDRTVVPGYSSLGYLIRRHWWDSRPIRPTAARVAVTGASSGIGEAICTQLAAGGARVLMVVRDRGRGERARERVAAALERASQETADGQLELALCDVADLAAVSEFAARLRKSEPELAGLIHCAGVLNDERERSPDGHELTIATAAIGPFLLTRLLEPSLHQAPRATVVFVSSGGMYTARLNAEDLQLERRAFDGPRFYAHAKRVQVVLAGELAARAPDGRVAYASMHPGWVATHGLESSLPHFYRLARPILRDPGQGADTASWLVAGGAATGPPGAFWHDRRPRPKHLLPWTREDSTDRDRVWAELIRVAAPFESQPGT